MRERYLLSEILGEGGMGTVYLAKDRILNRRVAIKVLHSHVENSSASQSRFVREARTVANLSHPNIVSVFDFFVLPTGQLALVTEYVEGKSLETLLESKLSLPAALDISIEIASALQTAHQQGVVHRDIKPSNVLLSSRGQVKLLDFGIAKLREDDHVTTITRAGDLVGTPAYMAPEQVTGEPIDSRADLYSLGVLMYRMLTGRNRYGEGLGTRALMHKIVTEQPEPPSLHNPLIPPELDLIVMKCLEPKPENRFATAEELITALTLIRQRLPEASTHG